MATIITMDDKWHSDDVPRCDWCDAALDANGMCPECSSEAAVEAYRKLLRWTLMLTLIGVAVFLCVSLIATAP